MDILYECFIKKMLASLCMSLVLMIGALVYWTLYRDIARIRKNIDCCNIYPDIFDFSVLLLRVVILFFIILVPIAYFNFLLTPCTELDDLINHVMN